MKMFASLRRAASVGAALAAVLGASAALAQPPLWANGTVPVRTSAASAGLVARASYGALQAYTAHSSVAGWFMVIDAAGCPANGAVTPIDWYRYATADVTVNIDYGSLPIYGLTGLSICFSTTGPYTLTASTTATISAKVR